MFSDDELNKYADVLLWGLKTAREKKYQPNDIILIKFDLAALPLAEILNKKILSMKMNPILRLTETSITESSFYTLGNPEQLKFIPPGENELYQRIHGMISLRAPDSIMHLKEIDSQKIALTTVARNALREILTERETKGDFGWTLCMLPTPDLAKHANLSIEEYKEQIVAACFLNTPNPVTQWETIFEEAKEIKQWINGMKIEKYRMESEKMDIEIFPGKQRQWIGISGHNIPSFELFISPDYHKTRGWYHANQPSFRNGNLVEGVSLYFEKGRAIKIQAEKGETFLKNQLAMDEGACRLGEYSLTDRRFSNISKFMANTLFDENFGGDFGNSHIAVGSSYLNTYKGDASLLLQEETEQLGFNKSALHWDLVNTNPKQVTATLTDGTPILIYENGEFKN